MIAHRPILFAAAMVRAILSGSKVQTRRVMKPQPEFVGARGGKIKRDCWVHGDGFFRGPSPYGVIGDRLWVRETFLVDDYRADIRGNMTRANDDPILRECFLRETYYRADGECCDQIGECCCEGRPGWRPSIHMPRWASRITLEITDVRVERVQSIGEMDAIAEGVGLDPLADSVPTSFVHGPVNRFRSLWTTINGPESWASNPWVYALTFRRL